MNDQKINRLDNLENLISKIKSLDEDEQASGFVLVAKNKPREPMTFTVTTKNLNSTTIIGALEQFKHGFMNAYTHSKKKA